MSTLISSLRRVVTAYMVEPTPSILWETAAALIENVPFAKLNEGLAELLLPGENGKYLLIMDAYSLHVAFAILSALWTELSLEVKQSTEECLMSIFQRSSSDPGQDRDDGHSKDLPQQGLLLNAASCIASLHIKHPDAFSSLVRSALEAVSGCACAGNPILPFDSALLLLECLSLGLATTAEDEGCPHSVMLIDIIEAARRAVSGGSRAQAMLPALCRRVLVPVMKLLDPLRARALATELISSVAAAKHYPEVVILAAALFEPLFSAPSNGEQDMRTSSMIWSSIAVSLSFSVLGDATTKVLDDARRLWGAAIPDAAALNDFRPGSQSMAAGRATIQLQAIHLLQRLVSLCEVEFNGHQPSGPPAAKTKRTRGRQGRDANKPAQQAGVSHAVNAMVEFEPIHFHSLFTWAPSSSFLWSEVFLIFSVLDEYGTHICIPALGKLPALIGQAIRPCGDGRATPLHPFWTELLLSKALQHANTGVRKAAIGVILELPSRLPAAEPLLRYLSPSLLCRQLLSGATDWALCGEEDKHVLPRSFLEVSERSIGPAMIEPLSRRLISFFVSIIAPWCSPHASASLAAASHWAPLELFIRLSDVSTERSSRFSVALVAAVLCAVAQGVKLPLRGHDGVNLIGAISRLVKESEGHPPWMTARLQALLLDTLLAVMVATGECEGDDLLSGSDEAVIALIARVSRGDLRVDEALGTSSGALLGAFAITERIHGAMTGASTAHASRLFHQYGDPSDIRKTINDLLCSQSEPAEEQCAQVVVRMALLFHAPDTRRVAWDLAHSIMAATASALGRPYASGATVLNSIYLAREAATCCAMMQLGAGHLPDDLAASVAAAIEALAAAAERAAAPTDDLFCLWPNYIALCDATAAVAAMASRVGVPLPIDFLFRWSLKCRAAKEADAVAWMRWARLQRVVLAASTSKNSSDPGRYRSMLDTWPITLETYLKPIPPLPSLQTVEAIGLEQPSFVIRAAGSFECELVAATVSAILQTDHHVAIDTALALAERAGQELDRGASCDKYALMAVVSRLLKVLSGRVDGAARDTLQEIQTMIILSMLDRRTSGTRREVTRQTAMAVAACSSSIDITSGLHKLTNIIFNEKESDRSVLFASLAAVKFYLGDCEDSHSVNDLQARFPLFKPLLMHLAFLQNRIRAEDGEMDACLAALEESFSLWPEHVRSCHPPFTDFEGSTRALSLISLLYTCVSASDGTTDGAGSFVSSLVTELINMNVSHTSLSSEAWACMPNSKPHRARTRLWQLLCSLVPLIPPNDWPAIVEQVSRTCMPINNAGNVRRLQDIFVMAGIRAVPALWSQLLVPGLSETSLRAQVAGSYLTIAINVLLEFARCNIAEYTRAYDVLFPLIVRCGHSYQHLLRIMAHIGIHAVLSQRQELNSAGLSPELTTDEERLLRFVNESTEVLKFRDKNYKFVVFDAAGELTPERLYCVQRTEGGAWLQDTVPSSAFARCCSLETEVCAALGYDSQTHRHIYYEPAWGSARHGLRTAYQRLADHSPSMVPAYKDMSNGYLDYSMVAQPAAAQNSADDKTPAAGNVQRKVQSWWAGEIYNELHPRALGSAKRQNMIIVSSLLENPVNIAGLFRCGDIFASESIVVSNRVVFEHSHFIAAARSAELWVPWQEVPPSGLPAYLLSMRQRGYTAIGIEQTADSVSIAEFTFPTRAVIVLGSEGQGIDAAILPYLDVCVEIPQFGLIRSLNVHVTGAIAMYEFTRQQLM